MEHPAEKIDIQGLGWIVRRGNRPPPEIAEFYQAAWGLPAPRGPGPTGALMFWAGGLTMFQVSTLKPNAATASRAGEMSIVMSTTDFPKALQRMRAAGASQLGDTRGSPRSATLTDPEGRLLGLQAYSHQGVPPAPIALPGVPALPQALVGIRRVSLRVESPARLAKFYQTLLDLERKQAVSESGVILDLGRGVELALRPGGRSYDAPTDRMQVPDVWILRVGDLAAATAHLRSMNVPVINERRINGGAIGYGIDPEGHLFGLQERSPKFLEPGGVERVEDKLARELARTTNEPSAYGDESWTMSPLL